MMNQLIKNLKAEVGTWDGADNANAILEQLERTAGGNAFVRFFRKRGEFSITRTILIISWFIGLMLYLVGSLFAGAHIPVIRASIPAFDVAAFLAVTGAASSLYFANHNVALKSKKD